MNSATNPYNRPGKICNSPLLENESGMNLKESLVENFDYIAVPKSIWRALNTWYSCDWCLSRVLISDPLYPENERQSITKPKLILDLYPEQHPSF